MFIHRGRGGGGTLCLWAWRGVSWWCWLRDGCGVDRRHLVGRGWGLLQLTRVARDVCNSCREWVGLLLVEWRGKSCLLLIHRPPVGLRACDSSGDSGGGRSADSRITYISVRSLSPYNCPPQKAGEQYTGEHYNKNAYQTQDNTQQCIIKTTYIEYKVIESKQY